VVTQQVSSQNEFELPNIVGLEKMGICAYLPTSDLSHRTKFYPAEQFQYDAQHDQYICPQGQKLLVEICPSSCHAKKSLRYRGKVKFE
jgi:hypothetical protein